MYNSYFHIFCFFNQHSERNELELLNVLQHGIPNTTKYSENVRDFFLTLHYYSPRAYRFVRRTFMNHLPHEKTMQRWMANSDVNGEAGIQQNHIEKLKRIATDFESLNGTKMICSLVFDEISLRQQIYWSLHQSDYAGFTNNEDIDIADSNNDQKTREYAKQAIAFILNGINCKLEFPVAYYFINKLNHFEKKKMVYDIIVAVTQCGITIMNLTFDGYKSNVSMCRLFEANIDVATAPGSPELKTYILNPVSGEKIYLIMDPCHMEKLIRNHLAIKKVFYDDRNEKVEFKYFQLLYEFSKKYGFHTNKLSKKHLQWRQNIMSVRVAVETFSESVANSMQFLMEQKHPDFENAGPTIRYIPFAINLSFKKYISIATN